MAPNHYNRNHDQLGIELLKNHLSIFFFCPSLPRKRGHTKTGPSVCLSFSPRYKNFNLENIIFEWWVIGFHISDVYSVWWDLSIDVDFFLFLDLVVWPSHALEYIFLNLLILYVHVYRIIICYWFNGLTLNSFLSVFNVKRLNIMSA